MRRNRGRFSKSDKSLHQAMLKMDGDRRRTMDHQLESSREIQVHGQYKSEDNNLVPGCRRGKCSPTSKSLIESEEPVLVVPSVTHVHTRYATELCIFVRQWSVFPTRQTK